MNNNFMKQAMSGAMQSLGQNQQYGAQLAPMNRNNSGGMFQHAFGGNQRTGPGLFGMARQTQQNKPQQAVQGFNNAQQQYMHNNQGGMFQHAFGGNNYQSPGYQTHGLNPQQQAQMNADRARYGLPPAQHAPQWAQGPMMGPMYNMMNIVRGQY